MKPSCISHRLTTAIFHFILISKSTLAHLVQESQYTRQVSPVLLDSCSGTLSVSIFLYMSQRLEEQYRNYFWRIPVRRNTFQSMDVWYYLALLFQTRHSSQYSYIHFCSVCDLSYVCGVVKKSKSHITAQSRSTTLQGIDNLYSYFHWVVVSSMAEVLANVLSEEPVVLIYSRLLPSTDSNLKPTYSSSTLLPLQCKD